MKRYLKIKIVHGLESLCELTRHRWCHRLAVASFKLDKRWELSEWYVVDDSDN